MQRRALVVGSQIERVTGADYDASRMCELLIGRGFTVDLRLGGDATRAGILDGYDALIGATAAGDAAVVFYSGHGLYSVNRDPDDAVQIVQAIAPSDLRAGGDDDFRGITAWELAIKLAQLTARTRNVTVILDCCHAAQMTRDAGLGDLVPRALPHPVHMGFRAHLRALEHRYGRVPLDPIGNPDAVRVVACSQHEAAFEHTNPAGKRAGIFTEALYEILGQLGDTPISWAAIGDAIRERVMRRYVLQRPDVEGPAERQLFSLAVDPPRGAVQVTRPRLRGAAAIAAAAAPPTAPAAPFRLHAGWITGVAAGDRYGVMPLGAAGYDAARAIATLAITDAAPMTSAAAIERWQPGHTALPDDAVAFPIERRAPTYPVAIVAPAAAHAGLARAIAGTGALHAATPDTAAIAVLATVRLAGAALTIEDAAGPLFPALRFPDELDDALHHLTSLGVARRIRGLVGDHGLSAERLAIAWGVVEAGAPRALPDHGAALPTGARIYLTARNTDDRRRYIHILNIGLRGTITLLTKARAPAGIRLDPRTHVTLGEHHGRLTGLALIWPPGLPSAAGPRIDELFVFVTAQPISLRGLETYARLLRSAPSPGVGPGAAAGLAADAFSVKRLSYALVPPAALTGP
ncbi:MAG TPA: caspase family protein [Kofleriaceae bacterium]|jgi:hypothetical protein|nr:caspase family protein [Kofleriaceae bacterium]